ncbi:hypothetical protein CLHUN_30010 [Ruminiclostridium hungatei]|uniref:HTH cro/C1-type domain-containing protein n=2 Tax=Ruminiclostridium hungatei TaxID=48256 RepID=A0A1V4SIK0_RUMHU|nr:hypothetical protein CLHUN_30010 [Ruminiclostridium hungatei]
MGYRRGKDRVHDELLALKGRIREKKTSYRGLSEATGISVNALNNKINGYTAMDTDEVQKLAAVLDIDANDIVKYFFPSIIAKRNIKI